MGRKITQYPNNVSVTPDELSLLDVSEKTGLATYESRKWTLSAFKAWLNANITIPVVDGTQGQIPLFVQDDEIGSNTRFTFIDNEGTEVGFRFSDSAGNLTQAGVTFLNVETQGIASDSVARLANWSDTTNKGIVSFRKSRGTKSAPTQVLNGDILGHLIYAGQHNFGGGTTTALIEVASKTDYEVTTDLVFGFVRNALTEFRIFLAPTESFNSLPSGFANEKVFSVDGDGNVGFRYYNFPLLDGSTGNSLITNGAGQLVWGTPSASSATSLQTIGRNSTGSTLRKGTIVYISGSTGNRPNFVKAKADAESTSAGTFGVVVNDIPNNSDGYVATIGTLDTLDTRTNAGFPFTSDTLADGDKLYLSPTTAGYVTNVKPSAPNHMVYVGTVVRTSPTNGTIVYRIQNGFELEELHNVAISSLADNDVLQYESSTQLWKNKPFSGIDGSGSADAIAYWTDNNTLTFDDRLKQIVQSTMKGILIDNTANATDTYKSDITMYGSTLSIRSNAYANMSLFSASDSFFPQINLARKRGNINSPTNYLINDTLGSINSQGIEIIEIIADENESTGKANSIIFYTGIPTTQNTQEVIRLKSNGKLRIGNAFDMPKTDGTNGQVLTTDGAGNVSWGTGSSSSSFIPSIQGNEVFRGVTFANNSTTITSFGGITNNLSGSQFANSVATTNYRTRQHTMRFEPSVVSTGNYCCMRNSAILWSVSGGFYFVGEFGISDAAYAVGTHNFWGLTSSTANLAIGGTLNSQPSALLNIIAVANDSGDANLQIMHNDSAGVATKIDLGVNFPSNRTSGSALTNMYLVEIYNAPSSTSVKYRVTNKETGVVAQGTITTNLPDTSTLLAYQAGRSMGTTGGGITNSGRFDVARLGVYTI